MNPLTAGKKTADAPWSEHRVPLGAARTVTVRLYAPSGEPSTRASLLVLHLHGGAFTGGNLDAGLTSASLLAAAGALVASVDYPLAPLHSFPAALEAAYTALQWLARRRGARGRGGLYVAGDEAGGNLAAALALMTRDQCGPALAGQLLVSPMLDPCLATASLREAHAGCAECQWTKGWHAYLGSAERADHPYAAPLYASRLTGLPPALLLAAADDPLRDEGQRYAERLRQAGNRVTERLLPQPTGWPASLLDPANVKAPWAGPVRDAFIEFFRSAAAPRGQAVSSSVR